MWSSSVNWQQTCDISTISFVMKTDMYCNLITKNWFDDDSVHVLSAKVACNLEKPGRGTSFKIQMHLNILRQPGTGKLRTRVTPCNFVSLLSICTSVNGTGQTDRLPRLDLNDCPQTAQLFGYTYSIKHFEQHFTLRLYILCRSICFNNKNWLKESFHHYVWARQYWNSIHKISGALLESRWPLPPFCFDRWAFATTTAFQMQILSKSNF